MNCDLLEECRAVGDGLFVEEFTVAQSPPDSVLSFARSRGACSRWPQRGMPCGATLSTF